MKIENAIILAAGRGSRMRELTNDKPKCMSEINNRSIIQRTIETLKYKNINNIIVVTGYKSEILRRHLESINDSIKIIENKDWEKTNSIASMKLALQYLKNSIVIDSDICILNRDIIRTDIDFSGYSALKEFKPNEWQLKIDRKNGFIEEVMKSGDYEKALPIIDISYWTEKDSNIIAERISSMDLTDEKAAQRFWDEIPLFDCLHQLKLRRYDICSYDAMEFDTPEELKKVREALCLAD